MLSAMNKTGSPMTTQVTISTDVVHADGLEITRRLEAHAQAARGAVADQTRRALASDSRIWSAWCAERNISALPAEPTAVVAFVDAQAVLKSPATVRRYIATIAPYAPRRHTRGSHQGRDSPLGCQAPGQIQGLAAAAGSPTRRACCRKDSRHATQDRCRLSQRRLGAGHARFAGASLRSRRPESRGYNLRRGRLCNCIDRPFQDGSGGGGSRSLAVAEDRCGLTGLAGR
jgi:hypothetical protein